MIGTSTEGERISPAWNYFVEQLTTAIKATLWLCLYALLKGRAKYFYVVVVTLLVGTHY